MVLHKSLNLHSFDCHHVSIYLTTVWISSGANCLAIDGNTFQGGSNEKLISQESPMVCTHKHTHTQTHCLPTSEKPPGQSPSVLTRAIWDEDVPFKTFMTFLPPGLCLWAVANQNENVRQRYWAVSHGVRTWELAHLGSTGNKSYCVSSGYYCSQHVLKSWTICLHLRRRARPHSPETPLPYWLFSSNLLLSPQRVLLRQPWFSCCFSYVHGLSQLKALCLLLSLPGKLLEAVPSFPSSLCSDVTSTSPTTTSLSTFLPFIILPDSIFKCST